tara:strand:- start:156 stop:458 length:303 start_codon:yes stop_codon:yes gene_type:complete
LSSQKNEPKKRPFSQGIPSSRLVGNQDRNNFSKFSPRLQKFFTKNVAILRENIESICNGLMIRKIKRAGKKEMRASAGVNKQMLRNALKAFTFLRLRRLL